MPASDFPVSMAGLAAIASPAELVAGAAAAHTSGGAPATKLPTQEAEAVPPSAVDGEAEEGGVDDNMGLRELQVLGARAGAVSPTRCLDVASVAIKREG